MDALIFDFDGVIVDSEPVHLLGFQRVLAGEGIELTVEEYYSRYLGYDDRDCFRAVAEDRGISFSRQKIIELTADKSRIVQQELKRGIKPLPGAVELVRSAKKADVPLAVCSGALREEIMLACGSVGLDGCFDVIVAAQDVGRGKPDPQGYLLALRMLGEIKGRRIIARRSLVVEDSPAGIEAGKAAGMKVLAVTNSYPSVQLSSADRVVETLAGLSLENLYSIIGDSG